MINAEKKKKHSPKNSRFVILSEVFHRCGRVTALHAPVQRSISGMVSIPPWKWSSEINFFVKARYVLLIANHLRMGTLYLTAPLVFFDNSRLRPAPGFSYPNLILMTQI